jgi:hypothetical protein
VITKCNNAGRKPVFSAKPIPSIPTKTMPNGGKSIKLLTIDDNNHHTPSEDKRFLTMTRLLLWSVIEKLSFEIIIDKANIKNVPIKNKIDGSGNLLPVFSIKDSNFIFLKYIL